ALSHLYQRRPGKALPDLDLALRYLPMDGYLRDWRAVVLALLGRTDEALADLKRDGADAGTLCLRGSIRHVRGENEEALADFSEAVERDPRWADAFAGRAAVQSALRRSGEAEEDFTRAIELESREAAFHEGRGMARRRAGRLREAAEDLARAVELSPSRLAGLQPLIDEGRK
ncbi:MAG TPA: tetratricopeptide repeat protein, partial [Planctomycetota bacterium]|nr:tetratricopeptide repeat protein [Planctomycetota bacterium]